MHPGRVSEGAPPRPAKRNVGALSGGSILRYLPRVTVSAEALAHLSREEAKAASAFARGLPGLSLDAALSALERPLGARASVSAVPLELWPPGSVLRRPEPYPIAVVLGDEIGRGRLVLELEPSFAGFLVDRALGAAGPEPRLSPGPASDGERGTLAYLAALALAHAGGRYRVLGVVSTAAAFAHALGGAEGLLFAHAARVELAGVNGWARLFCEPRHARGSEEQAAADGTLALELPVLAGRAALPARELAALGPGDVLLPDDWWARPEGGRWRGEARAETGGRVAFALRLGETCDLARREPAAPHGEATWRSDGEGAMSDASEVPVEISIEVGRLVLTVAELGSLTPGAVLGTGVPLGPVVLRVGPRIVARGELATVDGELGVRILERA